MKEFVALFKAIDSTTKTNKKINALVKYFETADEDDKLWTVAIFSHRRPPRAVNTALLRQWASEMADLPTWLFEETYHIVGDLAETIALVIPPAQTSKAASLSTIIEELRDLKPKEEPLKKEYITDRWNSMTPDERFVFNKLITGGFRVGVSQKTMVKALSKHLEVDENTMAHRLMGDWKPGKDTWTSLVVEPTKGEDQSKPYPFYLAYALDTTIEDLGDEELWSAEWKWDGIRGQLIKRKGELFVWSRGEDLVTDKFPEFECLLNEDEDDFVIDGEIIPIVDGIPLNFNMLQSRIGRKNITKKHLKEVPIHMIAYDLLEYKGEDIRQNSLLDRRQKLTEILNGFTSDANIVMSESITFHTWQQLAELRQTSRANNAEGLMLKKLDSDYKVGRKKGDWWKWKVDPLEVDAVMLYAQRGHGRRSNLYTDFTFAVWDGDLLVPFAKAYSGLTDEEFKEVTKFVKNNTRERFGPVASVNPELVFTIAFEGIAASPRHKSGIALRFPRISRWRKDKKPSDIDRLETLKALI